MRGGARARRVGAILAGVVALVAGVADEARAQSGLPLPPGVVLTGPVFKQPGQCPPGSVPSLTTGADANAYICSVPPTASFIPTAPAAMVVTSAPTQYVRVYCPECSPASFPNRSFMADPSTIRGLTPAQIKDVLALPSTPTMITIVTVPSGSCVLVAQGAAIPGFGSGGTAQAYAAGTPSGPNCQGLQFLPASDYINQQAIGAFALAYQPRAGGGNGGAVAAVLDRGPYAAPFTDMDGIYKSLDLLNFGDSTPLRAALAQLDGEIYADVSTVVMGAGQLAFLGAVRERARAATKVTGQVQQWLSVFGGAGDLSGNGDSHNVRSRTAGVVGGLEHQFDPSLHAGIAFGYAGSGFNTSGISGSGTVNTLAITPYARYAPGRWYVEGAIGAATATHRSPATSFFPALLALATGNFNGTTFLSQVETGYRLYSPGCAHGVETLRGGTRHRDQTRLIYRDRRRRGEPERGWQYHRLGAWYSGRRGRVRPAHWVSGAGATERPARLGARARRYPAYRHRLSRRYARRFLHREWRERSARRRRVRARHDVGAAFV